MSVGRLETVWVCVRFCRLACWVVVGLCVWPGVSWQRLIESRCRPALSTPAHAPSVIDRSTTCVWLPIRTDTCLIAPDVAYSSFHFLDIFIRGVITVVVLVVVVVVDLYSTSRSASNALLVSIELQTDEFSEPI